MINRSLDHSQAELQHGYGSQVDYGLIWLSMFFIWSSGTPAVFVEKKFFEESSESFDYAAKISSL